MLIKSIGTMPATALAAVASVEMIFFGEDNISLRSLVVVYAFREFA